MTGTPDPFGADFDAAQRSAAALIAARAGKPNGSPPPTEVRADRQSAGPLRALRVMSARRAMDTPPRSYLLDGLLAPRELSVWWGAPKCGKSFLLLRLTYGLALGIGMWGRSASRPVRALYLAAEGEGGLGNRLRALHDEMGDPGDAFAVIAQRMELGPPSTDLPAVIAAAKKHRADLVVVDTLARTFGPGNEDTAQDMGGFVASMDQIREDAGAHVAVIHHGAKDAEAKTPRGSGAILGAADLVVKVAKGCARVDHAKDDADGAELPFELRTVELGTRANGSPITTCLAIDTGSAPRRAAAKASLSPAAQQAVTFLANITLAEGAALPTGPDWPAAPELRAVPVERWRAECEARGVSLAAKPDDRRRAIDRAMNAARDAGAVAVRDGLVWLVRQGAAP